MSSFNKTAKDLAKTLKEINTSKPSGYDTKAEVIRVSGDTAWVHIPGSEIYETPVDLSIDVKKGDEVLIRISDGNAWITGNITAPPTDDTATKKLESKVDNQFVRVGRKADKASSDAAKALRSANGKNSVYYSDTRPTEGPFIKGDTWFNSAKDNQINEWNGTTWVPFELGEDAIADLSITNAKIAKGTIQAAKIGSCDVGSLTGGYINAGHIDTASLTIGGSTLGNKLSETDTELSDLSDTVDSFEDRIEAIYGVCDTPAGTAIKEVICDGFVPFVGAELSVKFTYGQNTSTGTPQLKILDSNSEIILDTKDIQFNNSYVSVGGLNRILWTSNTIITFMYDGNRWSIIDKPGTWYVLTSTSSSAVKYITYSGILMVRGTKIFVKFINKNTATGYLKLNLGFGDMPVRVNNSAVLAEDLLASTTKGDHLQFMYNGEFGWEYQDVYPAKTATNYITQINDEGIFVSPANQSPTTSAAGNSVKIDGEGMTIYRDGDSVAFYGEYARVGKEDDNTFYIRNNGFSLYSAAAGKNAIHSSTTDIQLTTMKTIALYYLGIPSGQTQTFPLERLSPYSDGTPITVTLSVEGEYKTIRHLNEKVFSFTKNTSSTTQSASMNMVFLTNSGSKVTKSVTVKYTGSTNTFVVVAPTYDSVNDFSIDSIQVETTTYMPSTEINGKCYLELDEYNEDDFGFFYLINNMLGWDDVFDTIPDDD